MVEQTCAPVTQDPTLVISKYGADALRLYLINSPVVRADNLAFQVRPLSVLGCYRGMPVYYVGKCVSGIACVHQCVWHRVCASECVWHRVCASVRTRLAALGLPPTPHLALAQCMPSTSLYTFCCFLFLILRRVCCT